MKLRGFLIIAIVAALAAQPLAADRAWGYMQYSGEDGTSVELNGAMTGSIFGTEDAQVNFFGSNNGVTVNVAGVDHGNGSGGTANVAIGIDENADMTIGSLTANTVTADSVTVGDAEITKTENGLDMDGSKLTNLADGTAATDAATVGQMNAADAAIKEDNVRQDSDIAGVKEANSRQDVDIAGVKEANTRQDIDIAGVKEANSRQEPVKFFL